MKGMIIYKGKYGATRQYAQWLSEKLNIAAIPASDSIEEQIDSCDYFVLGTSVYIGKLKLARWLKNNQDSIKGKKIFFYLVSATPPSETGKLNKYIQTGIPAELLKKMEIYFLHGRMKMSELSARDRFMLRMGAWLTRDPAAKKKMLTDFNGVKAENLAPLVKSIGSYITSETNQTIQPLPADLKEYF